MLIIQLGNVFKFAHLVIMDKPLIILVNARAQLIILHSIGQGCVEQIACKNGIGILTIPQPNVFVIVLLYPICLQII